MTLTAAGLNPHRLVLFRTALSHSQLHPCQDRHCSPPAVLYQNDWLSQLVTGFVHAQQFSLHLLVLPESCQVYPCTTFGTAGNMLYGICTGNMCPRLLLSTEALYMTPNGLGPLFMQASCGGGAA